MRRRIKGQLLSILNSLEEAEKILKSICEKEDYENKNVLLENMQQTAIEVGNAIEDSGLDAEEVVSNLEIYCELLWQCSQIDSALQAIKRIKKMSKIRINIANTIQYTIKDTLEVVFFPYKASMWDSMESVWLAARDSSYVETYVVPIPYYERKQDGSFGQIHEEREQYPNYVSISPWCDYDIKTRKPDIIFIHNPYDDTNMVTSVFPQFYASNLKKYTNMLVYIPYFIAMNDMVGEHFCAVPAVIYADKVIVQSEKVKEDYKRYFGNWIKDKHYEDVFEGWEEKFLALGSPKLDKVRNTSNSDFLIPTEWKKMILTSAGTRKKILFYNTTVAEVLNENENAINKIENVLLSLRNNSDVILLWRPHPLIFETCAAMRPWLLEKYENLVKVYKTEGWGIYDDTPDLNRAISISDAYYGGSSSVVALFESAGKPIMIQDVNILAN